jgi:hypothetical protein
VVGLHIPSFYIQTFAVKAKITDANLESYVLPIANAAGMFGRVVPNFFAGGTGPMNMLISCVICARIVVFRWIGVHGVASLMVVAILYGFFLGLFYRYPQASLRI